MSGFWIGFLVSAPVWASIGFLFAAIFHSGDDPGDDPGDDAASEEVFDVER